MKETTVQIDAMMSIFDGAGVEKQIKRRDGVMRVNAKFLGGTATIAYDETRVTAPASGWPRSRNYSEQRPDACGQCHGQCTPERDAYCAHRHSCATRACSQPA